MPRNVRLALLLGCLLPACASPASVSDAGEVTGVFVLESVRGEPVPAVWTQNRFSTTEVLADTLWLRADGTGIQRTRLRSAAPGEEPESYPTDGVFDYRIAGASIEISYVCRDVIIRLASCVAPPHAVGRVDEEGISLTTFGEVEAFYRRL